MASDEKFVVITGVSTGIGYDSSEFLIKHGFHVFGSVRTQEAAESCKHEFGPCFTPLLFDVRDVQAITAAAETVGSCCSFVNSCFDFDSLSTGTLLPVYLTPINLRRCVTGSTAGNLLDSYATRVSLSKRSMPTTRLRLKKQEVMLAEDKGDDCGSCEGPGRWEGPLSPFDFVQTAKFGCRYCHR
jgi:short chain dehydrogenase